MYLEDNRRVDEIYDSHDHKYKKHVLVIPFPLDPNALFGGPIAMFLRTYYSGLMEDYNEVCKTMRNATTPNDYIFKYVISYYLESEGQVIPDEFYDAYGILCSYKDPKRDDIMHVSLHQLIAGINSAYDDNNTTRAIVPIDENAIEEREVLRKVFKDSPYELVVCKG